MSRPWIVALAAVLLVPALAGCTVKDPPAATTTHDEENGVRPLSPDGVTEYLVDVSEPDPSIDILSSIVLHERIMVDGVALDTWIVRPDVKEPVPVVLQVTPYYSGGSPVTAAGHMLGSLGEELIPRGYAYGISSVRGTGLSGGCFTQGGVQEAKDTAAVIEHVAKEPWSNGNVGLIGVSYPGTTPQDVWVEAPPSLKTIVPISGISDLYKYNFVNGVHIDPQGYAFNAYYWALVGGPPFGYTGANGVNDPTNIPGAIAGEACPDQVWVQEGGASSAVDGNKDSYWQERDFLAELMADYERPRASVFYIHGLQDWNVKPHMMEDWLPAVQATGVPYKVWVGQWTHNWPQREDWWNATMVAWFDQFLKGIDTGILDAPAVQVQDDDGVWRHEKDWPPLEVAELVLHPTADGRLVDDAPAAGDATFFDNGGVYATAASVPGRRDRFEFVSEPLDRDIHVAGLARLVAQVTASGPRANLVLTLAERDGTVDRAINFAALSLNHAKGLANGEPSVAGLRQEIDLRFFPQDDVIHAGSRIVLIAAGNTIGDPGPSFTPLSSGNDITLHLGEARLVLPIDETIVVEDPQPCWEEECYLFP